MTPVTSLPSLREIAAVVFWRKWSVLFAFVVPVALFAAAPFMMTPTYEAQTRVLVKAGREFMPQSDVPGGGYAAPATSMREMVDTVTQIVQSFDLVEDVLRDVGIEKLYPQLVEGAPPGVSVEDAAVRALTADLSVAPVRLTNVIEIRLRNADREVAVEALEAALARFQARHVQAFSHSRSQALENEIASNLQALAAVQRERAEYVNRHNLFDLAGQRTLLVQDRVRLAQELREAQMRDGSLERLIAYLKAELARQPETITLQTTSQPSTVNEAAQRDLNDLRRRERELLQTMGPRHPSVLAVREQIAEAQRAVSQSSRRTEAVASGVNPLVTTLRGQLAQAEADRAPVSHQIATLQGAIRTADERLRQITEHEAELRRLDTRIADLEAGTTALRQRLTDARVSDELDRSNVAGLSVIQHPVALDKPVSPRKMLFGLAGLVAGGLAAAFVVLSSLTFGNRFLTPDTIERILGTPVLVSLPPLRPRVRRARLPSSPVSGQRRLTAGT